MTTLDHLLIPLPFKKPPLSLNDRHHWRVKARIVADLRQVTYLRARVLDEHYDAATVTLHYQPRDNRHRDKDNLYATLKPCIDGLVDAGILPADHNDHVEPRVRIHPAVPGLLGELWLTIEPLETP